MKKCFHNATLVLPDRLLSHGWLLVEEGKILCYGDGTPAEAEETIDCGGKYLAPGFIFID